MSAQSGTLRAFTDAAADAVARAIAGLRRDAQRERELRDAEHRARMAEWDARMVAVQETERRLAERVASLKDGEPGRDGKDGVNGKDGRDGVDGKDGAPGAPGARGPEGSRGEPGERGERGEPGQSVEGPRGEKGDPGDRGADGAAGKDGADGRDGKDGERGPEGPKGSLPGVRAWEDRVHYQGEVVAFDGGAYQASRDTGKAPPHGDWTCIVAKGRDGTDGRSFTIRGTYSDGVDYDALDVVALNGASFVARRDNPGTCPGEGWQLMASQGPRGKPGERGATGTGLRGLPGATVASMSISDDGMLRLVNGDGSTVECDLYPILDKIKG